MIYHSYHPLFACMLLLYHTLIISEEVEVPIRQKWNKITTCFKNPKWGAPMRRMAWKSVCNAPLLFYKTLIISEEVEIPIGQSWDRITTFSENPKWGAFICVGFHGKAHVTPLSSFTTRSSFQRRLKFPTNVECK